MNSKQKFSVVSLFSGAGGFDWGFHRTGKFQTLLACEKLGEPATTLAHNLDLEVFSNDESLYPISEENPLVIQGDIQHVDFSKINIEPDVLIGGPPCQDFSITISKKDGERPGLNGGRGNLYVEFVRALMFLQPKIFVFENVPGLISANERAAYPTILNDLQNLEKRRIEADSHYKLPSKPVDNYVIIFKDIINAPNIGVPQTRRRLIIIGMKQELFNSINLLDQTTIFDNLSISLNGQNSLMSRFPLTALEIFEGQALPELQTRYKDVMLAYKDLAVNTEVPKAKQWYKDVWSKLDLDNIQHDYFLNNQIEENSETCAEYQSAMNLHREILEKLGFLGKPVHEQTFIDGTQKLPRLNNSVIERMRMIPPDENYDFVKNTKWQVEGKDISFIYRRAAPLKPAWTVMAYGGGGTYGYHYERDRAQLTLRERARIQTFTDDFVFEGKKVRAQIGEAVPPLMGQHIGENIAEILLELNDKIGIYS